MYVWSKAVWLAATVSHVLLVASAPTPVSLTEVKRSELDSRGTTYPTVSGRLFNINGVNQYFAGTNAWWLGHLWSDADVDQAVSQMAATKYKVVRTWAFGNTNNPATETNVYFQTLNSSGQYINYNPSNGIARLDYAVKKAEQAGLKLIMTLLNEFDDLGGINTYINAFGGDHNGFYTNARAQTAYRNYIRFIVNRYKASPAIFSWELCNEPHCVGCNTAVITKWASDTSAYIKSLDRNHMVSLGDEGWLGTTSSYVTGYEPDRFPYNGAQGVDFEKILQIPTIDFGTFHMYANLWGYPYSWGNKWIEQHNQIGKKYNKPVVFEEYAVPQSEDRATIMGGYQNTVVQKTSIAGAMNWQFGTSLPSGNNPFDEYALRWGEAVYQQLGVQFASVMNGKRAVATM
ncbi:MAG: hypothetical protein Q9174_003634 [Haloplaca sp. 1 TL-2023]